MLTRYRVWLNGQGLHDIDPTIIITDVQESKPEESVTTVGVGVRDGLRILNRRRDSLSVGIRFELREYDTARRKAIYDKIVSWACDGVLTISDRPEQQLRVACDEVPTVSSALRWTSALTIIFTAYTQPYWEEVHPVTAVYTGSNGTVTIRPMGNMPCMLEADVYNTSGGTINTLTISANGSAFSFASLGLAAGATLAIAYEDGILSAKIGAKSVLSARTEASSDDIELSAQTNTVAIQAGGNVKVTIKARGRWR